MLDLLSQIDVDGAVRAIGSICRHTPLIKSASLSSHIEGEVYLKLENLQRTGSFKVRGASFSLMSLNDEQRRIGVVTCSSGNHGRAVAHVANRLSIPATVCVPRWIDPVKLRAIESEGASVLQDSEDYDGAERQAFEMSRERGLVFVHPFDARHILAGQGTLALEILEDLPGLEGIVAPLSGGGLVGGMAVALKRSQQRVPVLAVSAKNASVMLESLQKGHPVEMDELPTVASALSGGIGLQNQFTFPIVRTLVTEHVTVTEKQIADGMRFLATRHRLVVEGGGATGVAGVLAFPERFRGRRWAIVVSGGNMAPSEWIKLVNG